MTYILIKDLSNVSKILSPDDKWRLLVLVVIAIVSAVLESLNIALIFQLLRVVIEPEILRDIPFIGDYDFIQNVSDLNSLIILISIVISIAFVFKNTFLAYALYAQKKFVTEASARIGHRLLRRYLLTPYSRIFHRNSSELINTAINMPPLITSRIILPVIEIFTEAAIILGIGTVLFWNEPYVTTVVILSLLVVIGTFYGITYRRFQGWGTAQTNLMGKILKIIQEGLAGQKVIRALRKEHFFLEAFFSSRLRLAKVDQYSSLFLALPRLLMEVLMILGISLVIILVFSQGREPDELLAVLGLFAFAGLRIMPSFNRLLVSLSTIRMGHTPIETIFDDFDNLQILESLPPPEINSDTTAKFCFKNSLKLSKVNFTYPRSEKAALSNVSFCILRGQSIGLVGASGAGKTTLADIFLGLLNPYGGEIFCDGKIVDTTSHTWRKSIGYVPQEVFLIDDTVKRNVALGVNDSEIDMDRLAQALELASLTDVINDLPNLAETVVGESGFSLSGGQRQRIGIARALYSNPEILVFDEATSALDAQTEQEVIRAIDRVKGEKTMIIIAHRLSTIQRCDHLIFMKHGCVVDTGKFEELKNRNHEFKQMVGLSSPSENAFNGINNEK